MFAPSAEDVKNTRRVPFAKTYTLISPPPRQTRGKLCCASAAALSRMSIGACKLAMSASERAVLLCGASF